MTQGTNSKYKASYLDDYVNVDELVERMNKEYPNGRLITEIVSQIGDLVVFKATFYNGDSDVICTGHGAEKITKDKKLEKAESVARGRCLRVLLSAGVTAEEMEDFTNSSPVGKSDKKAGDFDSTKLVSPKVSKESTTKVKADNNAVKTLQSIQLLVQGDELLGILNDSLQEAALSPVQDLGEGVNKVKKLNTDDIIALNKVLMRKEKSYTA